MEPVVDLDDALTWPPAVRDFAEHWGAVLNGTTCYPGDLAVPPAAQQSFMTLIRDQLLRAYHCTRLLEEEAADIRREGLVPLTDELVASRILRARTAGHLTDAEGDALLAESALAPGRSEDRRRGQICAVAGRAIFDEDPGAVELLLSLWGGEAIYWAHEHSALGERLRALGKPSVVAAGLRLAAQSRAPWFFPALAKLFVGRHIGLQEVHGDVFFYGPVRAENIAGIWQPGDREYDRHRFLPRR